MKILIVEDDFTGRLVLQEICENYGTVHIAATGEEAVDAHKASLEMNKPYHLICLDIMMPEMDGQEVLEEIRKEENRHGIMPCDGVKIVMTTGLGDKENVIKAFHNQCDGYLVKPIEREKLECCLKDLGLLE